MDSIAQAAGRCSRHGEAGMTKTVYLVNIKDISSNHIALHEMPLPLLNS